MHPYDRRDQKRRHGTKKFDFYGRRTRTKTARVGPKFNLSAPSQVETSLSLRSFFFYSPFTSQMSVPTYKAHAWAATSTSGILTPHVIDRREPKATDVKIDILYCGICHSDYHFAKNEWGMTVYPIVPGHEIIGKVSQVGSGVTKFKVGQVVGVGCLVESDRTCTHCKKGKEHNCDKQVWTYGGPDQHLGGVTQGGYSESIVIDEHFVLRIPENLNLAAAAPLLCAGITTFSPLRFWEVGPGQKVGVVGLGGLGHMGVKFARALGAEVVVFTTSISKKDDAIRLGASEVVISTDKDQMKARVGTLDFILDTVSADHDVVPLINCLRAEGTIVLVGAPEKPISIPSFSLILGRKNFAGSNIGSIAETQEMLDFCGKHNIVADVEVIPVQKVNEAYQRLHKQDVKYRFSIDMSTLKKQ
jgi:alcohol dehydrogenase (NADP+)